MRSNLLYYGDNLDVLRRHVPDESVDLVYLDPPFNSNATYNVLFAEQDGTRAAAQIKAFSDTWRWDLGAAKEYEEAVEMGGGHCPGAESLSYAARRERHDGVSGHDGPASGGIAEGA